MTKITISCPITWHKQCMWVQENCKNYKDDTNWPLWQIGLSEISFLVEDKDAIWFALRWQ